MLGVLIGGLAQEPKGAATPEELLKKVRAAGWEDDMEAQVRLSGGPHRPFLLKLAASRRVWKAVEKALEDKFGKGKESLAGNERPKVEVKGKKELAPGRVEITYWEYTRYHDAEGRFLNETVSEEKIICIRDKTGWLKEYHPPGEGAEGRAEKRKDKDGKEIEVMTYKEGKAITEAEKKFVEEFLDRMKGVWERGAADVKAGKYRSKKEAKEAFDKAEKDIVRELRVKFKVGPESKGKPGGEAKKPGKE
jgi:hypothetical protein